MQGEAQGIEKIVVSRLDAEEVIVAKIMAVINKYKDQFNSSSLHDEYFYNILEAIQKEILNILIN